MTLPSNMPHRVLSSVREQFHDLDRSFNEVAYLMEKFLDAGHDPDIAAHLTQVALDNVWEDE